MTLTLPFGRRRKRRRSFGILRPVDHYGYRRTRTRTVAVTWCFTPSQQKKKKKQIKLK